MWLWAAVKGNAEQYCENVFMYANNAMSLSCDARPILEEVQELTV